MASEGAFEARKWGWRQTKEGIVVSFLVHPNDINAALAIAPLGTIYAIGFREMPEGDQSASPEADAGHGGGKAAAPFDGECLTQPTTAIAPSEAVAGGAPKQRRHFSELPRSAQAAMLCENPVFQDWAAKARGAPIFHDVTKDEYAHITAEWLRAEICKVKSRRELDIDHDAAQRWDALHARYRTETGQEAEQR